MKIVLFNDQKVLSIFNNVKDIKIEDANIFWDDGALKDVKSEFIIVNDEVEINGMINDEIKALDQKSNYIVEKIDEIANLKSQINTLKSVLDFIILNY